MDKKTIITMKQTFDDIMHTTDDGSVEFWYARELMECLGYATWRRFKEAVERAKESCEGAGIEMSDHFAGVGKLKDLPKGASDKRPLADFLPTLTIAAKNLATEMTNYNVEEKDLQGENAITSEHVQNNQLVRDMLGSRGIKPEELPPSEDIKKLERRVKSQEKKLVQESGKLSQTKQ